MAVSANIPGIGTVDVDGAASEATLQALVAAVAKANNLTYRSIKDTEKDLRAQAAAAGQASQSMQRMSNTAGGAAVATDSAFSKIVQGFTGTRDMFADNSTELLNFGSSLRMTAAEISKTWATAFNDISLDPINRASSTFTKSIDMVGRGVGLLAGNISKAIPGKLGQGVELFVQGAVKLGTEGFQMVNQILATEMQSTVKAMATFNDMGASFGGGMMEMRTMALDSGLSLQQFGAMIKENRQEVLGFGGTIADGSLKVSRAMEQLATQTGTSGRSLREELLNQGVSLEEQGKIAISLMANQRALSSTTAYRGASEKDIAMKTRQYAEDLKILSEQTGKDAKAVADRARQEAMRSAVLSKLTGKEQESLQAGLRGMETVPDAIRDNFKTALMQELSGGTITDPLVAGNQEYLKYVKETAARIKQGGDSVQTEQLKSTARLAQTMKKQAEIGDTIGTFSDNARLFGAANNDFITKQADAQNALVYASTFLTEEGIDKSKKALAESASTTEKTQVAFTQMQIAAADFNKTLGNIATNLLPTYANLIKGTNEVLTSAMSSLQKVVTGNISLPNFLNDLKNGIIRTLKDSFGTQTPNQPAQGRPIERRAAGGPVTENIPYMVGEGGPELFVPHVAGQILNMQSLQEKFAAIKTEQTIRKTADSTPNVDITKDVVNSIIEGPNGIATVMNSVKNQIADDNKQQLSMMQEQISRLNDLVSTMKENVRASENIVNVLT